MSNEQHNAPSVALPTGLPDDMASPVSPCGTQKATHYSWSTDEETFNDQCDSIEEAIAAAIDYHGELEVGQTIYVGEVSEIATPSLVDASNIVEQMQQMAFEYAGESSEDYLATVTSEQFNELQQLVAAWADSVERPCFWQVNRSVPHVITAEDLGETCEAGQPECGPAVQRDVEGVPLCQVCWDGLLADSLSGDAAEVKS